MRLSGFPLHIRTTSPSSSYLSKGTLVVGKDFFEGKTLAARILRALEIQYKACNNVMLREFLYYKNKEILLFKIEF